MPDLEARDSVQVKCLPSETITALHCHRSLQLTKSYSLERGKVTEKGYGRAKYFNYTAHEASGLDDLYELVKHHLNSPYTCLIRGVPSGDSSEQVRRTGVNFPMREGGSRWACIDIDGLALPSGIDPYGSDGVEYAVRQLPPGFHTASHIAQFSASAGVLNPDGTPYKPGLRVHIFFWFDRGVTNEELKGWLFDSPVDKALYTAVQPHYIADPILGPGVSCAVKTRLYLERKASDVVQVPDLSSFTKKPGSTSAPDTEWEDPPGGLPDFDDLLTCEFAEWYVSHPHPEGERYEATRAFAHNLRRIESDDWKNALQKLIPADFPYTDAIISSAVDSRPITCEHIYRCAYRCPRFNPDTGKCKINQHARTPYSLALSMKNGDQ